MKYTEKILLDNLITPRKIPAEQNCPIDDWNISIVGEIEILAENGFKTVPNKVIWNYARKYGKDDYRTAHICGTRSEADCIIVDDIDKYIFIDLDA